MITETQSSTPTLHTDRPLPEGWRWVRLGEIGRIVTGGTPPRGVIDFYGGDVPWVKPDDLDKTMYVHSSSEHLSARGAEVSRMLPPGSVMVSCIGKLGKCAIAGKTVATNQQINSVVPGSAVDSVFLYFAVRELGSQFQAAASTTIVPIVNKTAFSRFFIPLPPPPEQRHIAAILGEQMAAVERARAALEEESAAIEKLPAALLRRAFAGEL